MTTFNWCYDDGTKRPAAFQYFAVDQDGLGCIYTSIPTLRNTFWSTNGSSVSVGHFNSNNWKQSLIDRETVSLSIAIKTEPKVEIEPKPEVVIKARSRSKFTDAKIDAIVIKSLLIKGEMSELNTRMYRRLARAILKEHDLLK
jgi:hypothetical protein